MFQVNKGKDKNLKNNYFVKHSLNECVCVCSSLFCKQVCIQWKPIHIQPCRAIFYKIIKNL